MTLDELLLRVRVTADGADAELDDILGKLRGFVAEARKETKNAKQATDDSAKDQALAWAGLAAAAGTAFKRVCGAIRTGVEASNAYQAAVKGLTSVTEANGIGQGAMQAALDSVTDEFFSATAAATAFKNLLTRGYTLEQATQTITRLKDAAAYGRQSSMSLSQAVTSATEGIRNENSILVDNAGVTKNVAKMWEEYAKARGIATTSLTQAQKVEAEYQGIMQETAAQVGDLQKLSDGLAGAQARAANQTELLTRGLGEAVTPVMSMGTQVWTGILQMLTGIAEAAPGVTAGLTASTAAMTGLVAASAGLATVKKLLGDIQIAASSLGKWSLVAVALGLVAGAITAVQKAQEKAAKAEEERMAANREAASEQAARVKRLAELTERYQALSAKSTLNYSEQREMTAIQKELASAYGLTAAGMDSAAASASGYQSALEGLYRQEMKQLALAQRQTAADAKQALGNSHELANAIIEYEQAAGEYQEAARSWANTVRATANADPAEGGALVDDAEYLKKAARERLKAAKQAFEAAESGLGGFSGEYAKWFNNEVDAALSEIEANGGTVNTQLAEAMKRAFAIDLPGLFAGGRDYEPAARYVQGMVDAVATAASDADTSAAIATVRDVMSSVTKGLQPSEDDAEAFREAWKTLLGEDSVLLESVSALAETMGESAPEVAEGLLALLTGFEGLADGSDVLSASTEKVQEDLSGLAETAASAGDALNELASAFDWAGAGEKDATAQASRLLNTYKTLTGAITTLGAKTATLEKGQKELTSAQKKGVTSVKAAGKAVEDLARDVGYSGDSLKDLSTLLPAYAKKLDSELGSAQSGVESLRGELENAAACANVEGSVRVEVAGALSALGAVLEKAQAVMALLAGLGLGVGGGKGGGGGGGGGKKDAEEEARRAAEEAERLRKEAIQKDYDLIDHKRHLNQITLEEELDMLEKLRKKHQLNAEEIMEWEEKVYDLKKELRERDAESLDNLGDGVIDALEARYEAMLAAEQERLDASRQAWETWRDDSVKAIEDQISALDKLADTEDREKKDQEELRKIAKLRQEIEYERDEYNRAKLSQQLEQTIASREERLRKLELSDQKDALREEIERINQKADEETAVLDKEQEAVEKAYEERLKAANLRAEAEKLILTQSQDELLALIKDYAPDYDATGQTLGERLLASFTSKVGGIAAWFENFNAQVAAAQAKIASTAQSAADSFYQAQGQRMQAAQAPAVVNQTVNFYEPVESPNQAARRISQVNEELAGLLTGG